MAVFVIFNKQYPYSKCQYYSSLLSLALYFCCEATETGAGVNDVTDLYYTNPHHQTSLDSHSSLWKIHGDKALGLLTKWRTLLDDDDDDDDDDAATFDPKLPKPEGYCIVGLLTERGCYDYFQATLVRLQLTYFTYL